MAMARAMATQLLHNCSGHQKMVNIPYCSSIGINVLVPHKFMKTALAVSDVNMLSQKLLGINRKFKLGPDLVEECTAVI